jgi:RNA polymerase sigma factor (sigma-70 family)
MDPQTSDDVLMARAGLREAAAFRLLVERHQDRPYRIAWRMLGDQTEAEDVAQDALLRLWTMAPNWQAGGSGVAAWLTRVATNLCLDRLRRRRFGAHEDMPERADETPLADAQMMVAERHSTAAAAVATLPDRQRAAIILTYYEELPNSQAADMLDLNIKAFESLLLRARTALRTTLADLKEASSD